MFDWAEFRTAKGGIKLHTRWDYNLMIPDVVNSTEAKAHDRYGLGAINLPQSHYYVALIDYLLLELIKRAISKKEVAFSNLSEKIRFCLYHYLTLNYVYNNVREGVRKVSLLIQQEIVFEKNLFSG